MIGNISNKVILIIVLMLYVIDIRLSNKVLIFKVLDNLYWWMKDLVYIKLKECVCVCMFVLLFEIVFFCNFWILFVNENVIKYNEIFLIRILYLVVYVKN